MPISFVPRRRLAAFLLSLLIATFQFSALAVKAAPTVGVRKNKGGYSLNAKGLGSFHTTQNKVQNARIVQVPQSRVRLALWEERQANGKVASFYATSLDGRNVSQTKETSYEIKLRNGQFDPNQNQPLVPDLVTAKNMEQEGVYIVQFVTQPLEEFRQGIQALGGKIYKYVANHAYLVKLDSKTRAAVENLPYVRWVGEYHPAYRLEEPLLAQLTQNKDELSPLRYNIQVFERGAAQQEAVADYIREAGGTVHSINPAGFVMEATLTADQLLEVANMNEVLFIDRWGPIGTDMDIVRVFGGANFIESVAGFTGTGVRGEVMDVGVRTSHMDFRSRPLIVHGSVTLASHGTSTTGIVFGDGAANPMGRGMLPNGQGIVSNNLSGLARYTHTAELSQAPYFAVFQSNSWGNALTTAYTTISMQLDDILFLNDILIAQSQSNANGRNSRPEAWAKNIVSVGGINHRNTLSDADDAWGGASIGPAADGRIKPDLAHFYDLVFTTTSTSDTAYTTGFGGTSAATPIVAGHFGIFFEMWHNGIFGNPTRGSVFESRPHMTTSKAIMINTARQWNFSGEAHNLTRVHQGWGRPDLTNLYNLRNRMLIVDQAQSLRNGEFALYNINVDGATPLRITMAYPDPPGTTSAAQHRINDVTLGLISPSGDVYYMGNDGLLGNMWSTPFGDLAGDTKNTVENIFIEFPQAGVWQIVVIAVEVNEDGDRRTPEVDATFSLVASGIAPAS